MKNYLKILKQKNYKKHKYLVAHLHFSNRTKPNKNAKELPSQRTTIRQTNETERRAADNSSLAKWRV